LIVFLLIILAALPFFFPLQLVMLQPMTLIKLFFSQSIEFLLPALFAMAVSNFADIKLFWKLKQKFKKTRTLVS
jgi:uncharacterized PurR-regulated membrane protein YhhQ (DUF165 family)